MRKGRRRKKDPYQTNFERLSIYPSKIKPKENHGRRLKPGNLIKVRVTGVDEEGRPTGTFLNYLVIINNTESLEPGTIVKVKVLKTFGLKAIGEIIADD